MTKTRVPAHVWRVALECGIDHDRRLEKFGVQVDALGRPDREAAREAWHRFGAQILAGRHPRLLPCWAQLEFGRPDA